MAQTGERFAKQFASMDDAYMSARAADFRDISERLIGCLSGESPEASAQKLPDEGAIICAEELSPSETVALDKSRVLAFVTARGSQNSHTAILARSMNIPAVVGA